MLLDRAFLDPHTLRDFLVGEPKLCQNERFAFALAERWVWPSEGLTRLAQVSAM